MGEKEREVCVLGGERHRERQKQSKERDVRHRRSQGSEASS